MDDLFQRPLGPISIILTFSSTLKVINFQNEFTKSSFLTKYEQNIVSISALYYATLQGRNPYTVFGSYFGRNDDFINSFWNLLTFNTGTAIVQSCEPLE